MNLPQQKFHLISFKLCPFVQRSIITLLYKGLTYEITYINLDEPPAWFKQISPLGKVPILTVEDTSLFESAVINEYLNDLTGGNLLPNDILQKARCRGFVELATEATFALIDLFRAPDEKAFIQKQTALTDYLHHLEAALGEGPYFLDNSFSLVDVAWAPFFMRYELINEIAALNLIVDDSKIKNWSGHLLSLEDVKASVTDDFSSIFTSRVKGANGYLLTKDKTNLRY